MALLRLCPSPRASALSQPGLLSMYSMLRYSLWSSWMVISMTSPPPDDAKLTDGALELLDVFSLVHLLHDPLDLFFGEQPVVRLFRRLLDLRQDEIAQLHDPCSRERLHSQVGVARGYLIREGYFQLRRWLLVLGGVVGSLVHWWRSDASCSSRRQLSAEASDHGCDSFRLEGLHVN